MLKSGGISITDWLLRIFNICMEPCVVPQDWKALCIVPYTRGKVTEENVLIIKEYVYGVYLERYTERYLLVERWKV